MSVYGINGFCEKGNKMPLILQLEWNKKYPTLYLGLFNLRLFHQLLQLNIKDPNIPFQPPRIWSTLIRVSNSRNGNLWSRSIVPLLHQRLKTYFVFVENFKIKLGWPESCHSWHKIALNFLFLIKITFVNNLPNHFLN